MHETHADKRRLARRILMLGLGVIAALAILIVLSTVAFRVLVAYAPGYRDELAGWISDIAGQPVEIGRMDLVWRHWQPTLALEDVAMRRSESSGVVMHLRGLRLGFSIVRAIQGDFVPDRVVMVGPRLTVERDLDGSLRIYGLEKTGTGAAAPADWSAFLSRLVQLHHVVVRDGRVRLNDLLHPNHNGVFDNVRGRLTGAGQALTGALSADLPDAVGGRLQIAFTAAGERSEPARLRITGDAVISNVRVGTWLRPYLRQGVAVDGRIKTLHVSGVYADGRLQHAGMRLAVGLLQARTQTAGAQAARPLFDHLNMTAEWHRDAAGWAVSVSDIDLALTGAGAGTVAPALSAYVSYHTPGHGQPAGGTATLPRLPLAALGPWLGILRLPAPEWLARTAPGGELRDVKASWTAGGGISVSGQFSGLSTAPVGKIPGFLGLDGRFEIGPDGGHARLRSRGGMLRAPALFTRPLPIGKLDARLSWARTSTGWHVRCSKLDAETLDARATGHFEMDLPGAGGSPRIALNAAFAADSVSRLRPFVPLILPPEVRHWLHESITAGRVSDGRLVVNGALKDFPFVGKPGEFDVKFQVQDGSLNYADDWPAISNIAAHMEFRGLSMDLKTTQGEMMGVSLGPVSAHIDDFRDALLKISGRADADLSRQFAFLAESPLRDKYHGLIDALQVGGPAAISIDLSMPLKDIDRTQVSGEITLKGDRVVYHKWPQPFTDVAGTLRFSRDGLVAQALRARMQGLDLDVDLGPAPGNTERTELTATALLRLPRDREVVAPYVPALLLDRMAGTSQWRLSLSFSHSAAPGPVVLMSDLAGTAVTLPVPLDKPRTTGWPIRVEIAPVGASGLQVHVAASGLFDALMSLKAAKNGGWLFDRGLIRMGGAAAVLSPRPGLWVDGHANTADMAGWLNFVRAVDESGGSGAATTGEPVFQGINLALDNVTGYGQHWRNVRVNLSREPGGWLMTLASPDVDGTVHVRQSGSDASARVHVTADMARMRLELPSNDVVGGAQGDDAQPLDPTSLPAVSLRCAACTFNGLNLGRLEMQVDALADGLVLRNLAVNGDDFKLNASGRWTRGGGRSAAALKVHLETGRISSLIRALGYTPGIKAKDSTLKADLNWAPSAAGLGLAGLGGSLSLKLKNGVLLAVDPGAGRVLGLLNFYTLPRRLLLDFHDVVDKGLAFDRIRGSFVLRAGSAYTQSDGLTLDGPSLRMVMKGRVGLAAQDYDEDITVYPKVGSAVPIAGAVLGGPAVGALLLLAQQLLGKPLAQLTRFGYHVGGTWADPVITPAK